MKDKDFLSLTTMLRYRETLMLSKEKIDRMLDAREYDDAAKVIIDCGFPDMSGMSAGEIEATLQKRRSDVFYELGNNENSRGLTDLFRMKYDYHNVKVLVKSAGTKENASSMLSSSGRLSAEEISEAYLTGERGDLPPPIAAAIESASGILSRTGNPQLSDIEIDKTYFEELLTLAESLDDGFITDYIKLLIDSANIRIVVRSMRTGRDADFLHTALIPGGSVGITEIDAAFEADPLLPFAGGSLHEAVQLGSEAIKGGTQTMFELACDNTALKYFDGTIFISFGPAPVFAYLAKLEWEITAVRMILTGKLTGISPDVIRERLRDCHV